MEGSKRKEVFKWQSADRGDSLLGIFTTNPERISRVMVGTSMRTLVLWSRNPKVCGTLDIVHVHKYLRKVPCRYNEGITS